MVLNVEVKSRSEDVHKCGVEAEAVGNVGEAAAELDRLRPECERFFAVELDVIIIEVDGGMMAFRLIALSRRSSSEEEVEAFEDSDLGSSRRYLSIS